MPTKHSNFSQSLLGFGSYLLNNLDQPRDIDELWENYKTDLNKKSYFAKHSFDNFVLTLLFLYSIGTIAEKDGVIRRCD